MLLLTPSRFSRIPCLLFIDPSFSHRFALSPRFSLFFLSLFLSLLLSVSLVCALSSSHRLLLSLSRLPSRAPAVERKSIRQRQGKSVARLSYKARGYPIAKGDTLTRPGLSITAFSWQSLRRRLGGRTNKTHFSPSASFQGLRKTDEHRPHVDPVSFSSVRSKEGNRSRNFSRTYLAIGQHRKCVVETAEVSLLISVTACTSSAFDLLFSSRNGHTVSSQRSCYLSPPSPPSCPLRPSASGVFFWTSSLPLPLRV